MITELLTPVLAISIVKIYQHWHRMPVLLRSAVCGLQGHPAALLQIEPTCLRVKCYDCGYQSPGVHVGAQMAKD